MYRYAVLVFRDQPLTDEQQCAYSRNFGELEATLIAQMSKPGERRLGPVELGDISNLVPMGSYAIRTIIDRCMLWATGCGTRTRHSGQPAQGIHYFRRAWCRNMWNTEFADMRGIRCIG